MCVFVGLFVFYFCLYCFLGFVYLVGFGFVCFFQVIHMLRLKIITVTIFIITQKLLKHKP